MRVMNINTNGIRAAARKGFFDWLATQDVDFVCIQETKAQLSDLQDPVFHPEGFHCYYFDAEKRGYSGVALYSRRKPDQVHTGLGFDIADQEGRYIQADFGDLSVASLYLPSGSSGEVKQANKMRFLEIYLKDLKRQMASGRDYVICGDWNIVHTEQDIKNWKSNQKTSGCLPEERAWLDVMFDEVGWIDAFRELPQAPDQYTWWSNRGQAYAKNVGWRIDYQVVTPNLRGKVKSTSIYKDQRFSDHAPLIIEYDYKY